MQDESRASAISGSEPQPKALTTLQNAHTTWVTVSGKECSVPGWPCCSWLCMMKGGRCACACYCCLCKSCAYLSICVRSSSYGPSFLLLPSAFLLLMSLMRDMTYMSLAQQQHVLAAADGCCQEELRVSSAFTQICWWYMQHNEGITCA